MERSGRGGKYFDWKAMHRGKRKYTSRLQAWHVIAQIWLRERQIDSLHPYECRWTDNYRAGKTGASHIHIGHQKNWHPVSKRIWYYRHKLFVWPYFRLRRLLRQG